jgi:hypothetical protein
VQTKPQPIVSCWRESLRTSSTFHLLIVKNTIMVGGRKTTKKSKAPKSTVTSLSAVNVDDYLDDFDAADDIEDRVVETTIRTAAEGDVVTAPVPTAAHKARATANGSGGVGGGVAAPSPSPTSSSSSTRTGTLPVPPPHPLLQQQQRKGQALSWTNVSMTAVRDICLYVYMHRYIYRREERNKKKVFLESGWTPQPVVCVCVCGIVFPPPPVLFACVCVWLRPRAATWTAHKV